MPDCPGMKSRTIRLHHETLHNNLGSEVGLQLLQVGPFVVPVMLRLAGGTLPVSGREIGGMRATMDPSRDRTSDVRNDRETGRSEDARSVYKKPRCGEGTLKDSVIMIVISSNDVSVDHSRHDWFLRQRRQIRKTHLSLTQCPNYALNSNPQSENKEKKIGVKPPGSTPTDLITQASLPLHYYA